MFVDCDFCFARFQVYLERLWYYCCFEINTQVLFPEFVLTCCASMAQQNLCICLGSWCDLKHASGMCICMCWYLSVRPSLSTWLLCISLYKLCGFVICDLVQSTATQPCVCSYSYMFQSSTL